MNLVTATRAARRTAAAAALIVAAGAALAQNPAVTVTVDATANRRAISPYIYGVAFGSTDYQRALGVSLSRQGGNPASRVNWEINADNRANDWYYESIWEGYSSPGGMTDSFVSKARTAGSEPMVTLPMLDWVARLGPGNSKLASFSVAKYGAQTSTDPWMPDAGNGISAATGKPITGNDPNDANTPNSAAFQQDHVRHLVNQWGLAGEGGVRHYILDNEPSIWHATHRDVHPDGASMDEVVQKTVAWASAIKDVDPGALVVGPEEWGWSGFLYSGKDLQYGSAHGWGWLPDRAAHGNWDYLPYYLDQVRRAGEQQGRRLLDVFSVHWYPQSGEYGDDVSEAKQLLRNRSTRSLWDPTYTDESWIATQVRLIPRLKEWVAAYHPGIPVGITEYSWGADGHMNGATAQADLLGIFGREGLDYAARWGAPSAGTPAYQAFALYRNYDGAGGRFGDTSVLCSAPGPDQLSAFAAERAADGALTVMLVHKALSGSTPVTVQLDGFAAGPAAQVWQLAGGSTSRLADVAAGAAVSVTVPAQSVTLLVIPRAEKTATRLWVRSPTGEPGRTVQLAAVLMRSSDGARIAGRTLAFTVGTWQAAAVTDAQGVAYADYPVAASAVPGLLPVTVAFEDAQDPLYHTCSAAGTLTVGKARTTLWVRSPTGEPGAVVQLAAALMRASGGERIAGRTLTFTVGAWETTAITDAQGLAFADYPVPGAAEPGVLPLTVAFADEADPLYKPCSAAGTLTVARARTRVWVRTLSGVPGQTVQLAAVLMRASDGMRVAGRPLTLAIGSWQVAGVTDAQGAVFAYYTIPADAPAGSVTISATFADEADPLCRTSAGAGALTVVR